MILFNTYKTNLRQRRTAVRPATTSWVCKWGENQSSNWKQVLAEITLAVIIYSFVINKHIKLNKKQLKVIWCWCCLVQHVFDIGPIVFQKTKKRENILHSTTYMLSIVLKFMFVRTHKTLHLKEKFPQKDFWQRGNWIAIIDFHYS